MSSLKLARNLGVTSSRLRLGFHRRFHTTQRKALDEEQSSQFSGNKSSEDHGRYVTWERFSDQNTQYINRFSAVEKDIVKYYGAIGAFGESLNRLESKVDKGFDKLNNEIDNKIDKLRNEIKKLGDKMDKQFTNLHGAQKKNEGMLIVGGRVLLIPLIAICGKLGYDWYEQRKEQI